MFDRALLDQAVPRSCWPGWQETVVAEFPADAQAEYVLLLPRFRNDAGLPDARPG